MSHSILRTLHVSAVLLLAGCVERTLCIESSPPGAKVFLNDREVGRTPCEVGFTFYGDYDVRLERAGCQPLWTHAKTKMPWWEFPPFDLWPGRRRVQVNWQFTLAPLESAPGSDDAALLAAARELRLREQQAAAEEQVR